MSLSLLGGLQARLDPGGGVALPTKKAQALLAYLAVPLGQAHPRDKLAALLWGGIREDSARNSLRQALFGLRKALQPVSPAAVIVEGDTVAVEREAVTVDVAEFERLVASGTPESLERANELYRGDLLAGIAVDEPPFEEWLLGERERLRELALEALAKLLAHQRSAGAVEVAIQTALKLLALDPLQEPVHRTLMRLYAQSGRRGAALRQYQLCVGALQRELGVQPEAETKDLYQAILRERPKGTATERVTADPRVPAMVVTSRAAVADIPLIGRVKELEQLQAALRQACAGQGSVVAVLGEAGIGKTRLVGELVGAAERQGVRVLVGRCYESEQVLPFGPWVDAFRAGHAIDDLRGMPPAWRAELCHVLPELASPDIEPSKSMPDFLKVFESVTTAIGVLAGHRPLLLVLEDLHWADEMSLRLLAFVGRRVPSRAVLAAVTVRDEELADAAMLRRIVDELQRDHQLWSMTLTPLSRGDTLALVRTLARSGSDDTALAQLSENAWRASSGNPFVVVETVRSHSQGIALGGDTRGSGLASAGGPMLTEPVRRLVTRRLERLSERGRLLTTVAAVIGREFEFPLLGRAAGLGDAEAAGGVEELVRHRVLQGVGERFDFTHDRIRDVVRSDVLAPRRRVLHRSVAEAIETLYAEDLEPHVLALGLHYEGAEMWAPAMDYLRRAATRAFAHSAYRESATCFERALRSASHLPRTPETLDQMLEMQLQLRSALWPLGEFDRIAACLEEAERLALSLDDRRRLSRTVAAMSVLRWVTGDSESARRFAEKARDMAASLDDQPLRLMSNYYLGLARYLLAEYRDAEEVYLENVRVLTGAKQQFRLGASSMLVLSTAWLALPLAERGDFSAGLAHGRTALDCAEAVEDLYGIVSAGYCLAYAHALKGELDAAVPLLERALDICREREFGVWLPQITGCLGHVYAQAGRVDEGLALLERAIEIYNATRAWPFRALFTAHRGTACLLAGRHDDAFALGREALALAREHHERGHEAWALHLLGQIALQSERRDAPRAERHYREALALGSDLGMCPLVAHCQAGLANVYRRTDRRTEAEEHFGRATSLYDDMDMRFWLARAEAECVKPGQ